MINTKIGGGQLCASNNLWMEEVERFQSEGLLHVGKVPTYF